MKNPWDVLRGRELPVVVFWCYCVLGMALAMMFLGMFVMGAAKSDRGIYVAGFLFLAYAVWAHIALWTCASNARSRAWAYVARAYAGVVLTGISVTLIRSVVQ
jgi:xanthine/uracil permease